MKNKTEELIDKIQIILDILIEAEENDWSDYFEECKHLLMKRDFYGIERILSAYGGMGSFNDLVLGQQYIDGIFSWQKNAIDKNNKLNTFRSEIFELANYIKKYHEIIED